MQLRKAALGAAVGVLGFALGAGPAFASEIRVGNDPGNCPDADFPTIQGAVDAAAPGDRITVCPGTYVEQVTVPAGKDGLRLQSQKPLQAIIQAPPIMADPKAIVRVNGAHDTDIEKFTVQGPGGGPCDSIRTGVRVDSGGSADIQFNRIASIRDSPFSGCQNGNGVLVGRNSEATAGTARVRFNLIEDYQKGGVVVDGPGSSADIDLNVVRGIGPTATIAQNGIQVSRQATANVRRNYVADNLYSPQTVASAGVLLFSPGAVQIEGNNVRSNDVGIYAIDVDSQTAIDDNDVTKSSFDGIAVEDSAQARVRRNRTPLNMVGVGLYGVTGALVAGNRADGNGDVGLFADTDTANNTFSDNSAQDNDTFDCQDRSVGGGTAGTANTWLRNAGDTSSPPGICKPRRKGQGHSGHGRGHHEPPHAWSDR
jgi:parallel beta-helix repeat protein